MSEKVKARSFAFMELVDGPTLSICLEDGRHFYIELTDRQVALANADLGTYTFKVVSKQATSMPEVPFG